MKSSTSRFAPLLALSFAIAACGAMRGSASLDGGDPSLPLGRPLVVTADAVLRPGEYVRPAIDGPAGVGTLGVIRIDGVVGVELDLTGVHLRGTPTGTNPDENIGYGIVVTNSSDVVIRGGRLGGYKGCIVVENSERVTVEDVVFDGWYGERLLSTLAIENETDWLRPHENDRGEWLEQYGGAVSATDCTELTIRRCFGRHGQNGILLARSTDCEVYDNDFSFLSGWGLAMYRSSRNSVSHNIFDYCVRGYSHEVYWRGQDSAGILMFERCCDNVFAHNSATHGGDGLFLYGGQDIVQGRAFERGEMHAGGGDRNIWYANDFSYAVANGIEATFSSHNVAIGNRMVGCHQHGVWAGYSNNMLIVGNEIARNLGPAVAIEHGQDNLIANNAIKENYTGVSLWWDEDPELVEGPFGEHRETSSRDNWIVENNFFKNDVDLHLEKTVGLAMKGNRFASSGKGIDVAGLSAEDAGEIEVEELFSWMNGPDGSMPSGRVLNSTLRRWSGKGHPRHMEAVEWRDPELPGSLVTAALERGEDEGLETIVIGEWGPWDFRSGEPRPTVRRPGGLLAEARWQATWFRWDELDSDPRGDLEAWRARRYQPQIRKSVTHFSHPHSDAEVKEAIGESRFGLIAETTIDLDSEGGYRLRVVSDDGVRVSIDGDVVFEDWTWHAPKVDELDLELEEGAHTIEIEYFQIGGAMALGLELVRL